ncbi:hypothetical protein MA20_29050 [Bradyrhizobium japonicum]|uniref:Uncharacterized protein n=1 Tax=Bradyrhizobium japonicum TaxID=375 RepID=A0A0A3XQW5_BRAJP|nr:hypothetical protein [Bradyrhizobium japonicum]KGT76790.1 hypothetical protein MA20_29050 [Bradyrhizobium japonicum]
MSTISRDLNLLELRKSERDLLVKSLGAGALAEINNLKRNIENTLSRFTGIVPENEEQVYLFGIDIHHVLKAAGIKPTALGEIKDHLNPSVRVLFVCGLLGLSLKDAREQLSKDRKQRMAEEDARLAARRQRQRESENSLVEDIREVVAETASTLLPPEITPPKR